MPRNEKGVTETSCQNNTWIERKASENMGFVYTKIFQGMIKTIPQRISALTKKRG